VSGGNGDAPRAGMIATVLRDGQRDEVAVEEPLEIPVDGAPLVVSMRTPGHDEELALGFLYGEGLIHEPRGAGPTDDFAANVVEVQGPLARDPGVRRFYTTSSCGVGAEGQPLHSRWAHSRRSATQEICAGHRPVARSAHCASVVVL
jgi:FdhD protein